jgi:hypothetical protein
MNIITRRNFVTRATAGGVVAATLPGSFAAERSNENAFSFLLLGDTHFDRMEHHDLEWMRQHFEKGISQVKDYCRHTSESLPNLLQAAKAKLETANPLLRDPALAI